MRRLLVLAAFQVFGILGWASYHEYVWATAPTFRVPLSPRDPFDLIRGRYFVLNPQDASIDSRSKSLPQAEVDRFLGSSKAFAGSVLVGFCAAGDVYRVCALARPAENVSGPARFWCKGFATLTKPDEGWKLELDLGLRRFFIPNRLQLPGRENQEGWELEVSHRPGLSPLPRRLFFRGTPIDLR
jgi:hypothetical protein